MKETKDHKKKKPTKKQAIANLEENFRVELKRSHTKGLALGYVLALKEIKRVSTKEDFDIHKYLEKELELRSGVIGGIDGIYDKEKEKLNLKENE